MIGYYVHHHGRGHLHRAGALAAHLADTTSGGPVTVLSSLPRPAGWIGAWVDLPLDVDPGGAFVDPTAHGVLHWAPLGHAGLRRRMAEISAWLEGAQPRLVVSDVSQEVTLLCRLHGVPVVSVVLPGERVDPAHVVGLRASSAIAGFWPAAPDDQPGADLLPGLPDDLRERVHLLGGLSRYDPVTTRGPRREGRRRLVVLGGEGGAAWDRQQVLALCEALPDWDVTPLGSGGTWVDDPWAVITDADAAVVHGGQNAVAEVAAARLPAVVVPAPRPFAEQAVTAHALDAGPWPVVALDRLEHDDWPGLLDRVAALDGDAWTGWLEAGHPEGVGGGAAARFADLVLRTAPERPGPPTDHPDDEWA